jgi:hypothetical protein
MCGGMMQESGERVEREHMIGPFDSAYLKV